MSSKISSASMYLDIIEETGIRPQSSTKYHKLAKASALLSPLIAVLDQRYGMITKQIQ